MNGKAFLRGDASLSSSEKKAREVFFYIIFGVLTTAVSYISFILLDVLLKGVDWTFILWGIKIDFLTLFIKVVSWTIAVLFAFFTNRTFVFLSKGPILKELIGFISSRLLTLVVIELGFFQLSIWILEGGAGIDKDTALFALSGFSFTWLYLLNLFGNFLCMIGNYVLSKLFIFKKKKQKE